MKVYDGYLDLNGLVVLDDYESVSILNSITTTESTRTSSLHSAPEPINDAGKSYLADKLVTARLVIIQETSRRLGSNADRCGDDHDLFFPAIRVL